MTKVRDYALTLKFMDHKVDRLPSDYINILYSQSYKDLGVRVKRLVFEKDSRGMYHAHGVVNLPTSLYHKKLARPGLQPFLATLTDVGGWERYITKAR